MRKTSVKNPLLGLSPCRSVDIVPSSLFSLACSRGDKVNIEIIRSTVVALLTPRARSRIRRNSFKPAHSTNPGIRFPIRRATGEQPKSKMRFRKLSRNIALALRPRSSHRSWNMTLNVTPYTLGAERPNFPGDINSQRDFKTFINASLRFARFTNVLMNLLT